MLSTANAFRRALGTSGGAAMLTAASMSLDASPGGAQQFVTDDAGVADPGACELETWVGEEESWILPICRPTGPVEVTVGVLFADWGGSSRESLVVGEAKAFLAEVGPWGTGVVAGATVPTSSDLARPHEVYVYVPATRPLGRIPATAHVNLGWAVTREGPSEEPETEHHLTWAGKLAVEAAPRLQLIGEAFGAGTGEAGFQVGARTEVVGDRLTVDVSFGDALRSGDEGLGFQVGAHWTPPPWFR